MPAPMPRLTRRAALTGMLALTVAGCATTPPSPATSAGPLTLTQAFVGRTAGAGLFTIPLTGEERRFTAQLNGTLKGDTLSVTEDFVYDDGQKDRLTWVFRRTGAGRWSGVREDTVGLAAVIETGDEIRLTYLSDFRSPRGVTRLGFSDVIYRRADGVIVNDGVVTRYGLPVGKVRFEIRRP